MRSKRQFFAPFVDYWELMSDSYIIEVKSKTAGIVVRDRMGYRFFAADNDFNSLEGRYFRTAREAERAASRSQIGEKQAVNSRAQ
jgi:hypothetical protein